MGIFKRLFSRRERRAKINLVFPTSWEMMTIKQFKSVSIILSNKKIDRSRGLFLCLCSLSGIRPLNPEKVHTKKTYRNVQPFLVDGQVHLISTSAIAEACNSLAYIYDNIGLPPCPIDRVNHMLYGISFRQFFTADSFFLRYMADNNVAFIKEAVKQLTNGRKRKLAEWERTAALIWWNGVKAKLKQMYPAVFQEGSGFSSKTQAEILEDILSSVNGNRPQENTAILSSEAHSVLHTLNKIYADAKQKSPR